MTRQHLFLILLVSMGLLTQQLCAQTESLAPLKDGKSPETVDEAWGDYDPTVEPLETEVNKEWVEEGTVLRAVRYCIGTFKGQKSWMGAFYAFPEGGTNLPALVQIHGGGGAASKSACIDNAQRGYATISLNWREDDRFVDSEKLPKSAQTDWGAVEGKQVKESRGIEPDNDKRYDPVPSARNSGYFLRTLAARRALTFLEQQPEVDGSRMGVDGHSMGGVITLQTAASDSRVKAAAPSCAPPLVLDGSLKSRTASPNAYAKNVKRAMLFMSPSNDFHGKAEDVAWIIDNIQSKDFRIARSEHVNHKHNRSAVAAKELWFDAHLKGNFAYPSQPGIKVDLKTDDGRPAISITPDDSMPIDCVDIFYTRDGKYAEYASNRTRFWQHASPIKKGKEYRASLDLFDLNEPLWVFANIQYKLDKPAEAYALTQASDTFVVSTRMIMKTGEQLQKAGIKADGKTTHVIESFDSNWEKEWVVTGNRIESWRLNDSRIAMPQYGKLVIELQSKEPATLRVKAGDNNGIFKIKGEETTEKIEVYPFDLQHKDTKALLLNWTMLVRPMLTLDTGRVQPVFKKVYWAEISAKEYLAKRPYQLGAAEKVNGKTMLTFDLADQIIGRMDADNKTVKSDIKQGLQVHSHSEMTYFLKGEYSTFTSTLVPGHQSSVTFEVHADGKTIFDSGKMGGKSDPREIEVDVSGAQELKLVVTDGGNGWGGDWVMWANALCK